MADSYLTDDELAVLNERLNATRDAVVKAKLPVEFYNNRLALFQTVEIQLLERNTKQLEESSKRLEKSAAALNKLTWALIVLTVMLAVLAGWDVIARIVESA